MTRDEFEQAVRGCEDKLFRIAFLSLRNWADCQDAVQEALLKAWSASASLKHAEYFDTWLVRILINVIRDATCRAARHPTLELSDAYPGADFVPPDPDLANAVRALDGRLRAPLLLKYVAGYSVGEVARILRITPAQARWRLEQARKKLRASLGDREATL